MAIDISGGLAGIKILAAILLDTVARAHRRAS
jgi:hypothetical protein